MPDHQQAGLHGFHVPGESDEGFVEEMFMNTLFGADGNADTPLEHFVHTPDTGKIQYPGCDVPLFEQPLECPAVTSVRAREKNGLPVEITDADFSTPGKRVGRSRNQNEIFASQKLDIHILEMNGIRH